MLQALRGAEDAALKAGGCHRHGHVGVERSYCPQPLAAVAHALEALPELRPRYAIVGLFEVNKTGPQLAATALPPPPRVPPLWLLTPGAAAAALPLLPVALDDRAQAPGQGLDQGEGEGGPGGGSRRRPAGPGGGDGEAPRSHFYAPLACYYILTPPMHACQHTSRARPDSQLREGSTTRKGRVLQNAQLKPAKAVHMPQGDHFISGWTVSWQQHDKKWCCASRYIYWQACRERGVRVKRHHANGASS